MQTNNTGVTDQDKPEAASTVVFSGANGTPDILFSEQADAYTVCIPAGDYNRDELEARIENNMLVVISPNMHHRHGANDRHHSHGIPAWKRSFALPSDAGTTGIRAQLNGGELTFRIPKTMRPVTRIAQKIQIE